jgi:anti-sigma factor RsiW
MKHVSEQQLALYAGKDLSQDQMEVVEEHLQTCAECGGLLAEFANDRVVLLGSLSEPAADELCGVRTRVLLNVQGRTRPRRDWIWAMSAMTAVVVGVLLFPSHSSRTAMHPDPASISYLRVPYRPIVHSSVPKLTANSQSVREHRHRTAPGFRTVSLMSEGDGRQVLKMTTSDPDVVIFWQLDGRTQKQ